MSEDADFGERLGVVKVPGEVRAPGRVRRWVRGLLRGWAEEVVDVVELLTSEIVTNAVEHGPEDGVVEVTVWRGQKGVRVECADSGGGVPVVQEADDGDEGGRGLALLDGLSRAWGSRTDGDGTTVWFEVDA